MAIVVTSELSATYKVTIHRLNETFLKMSGESGYEDRIKPEKWVSLQNID